MTDALARLDPSPASLPALPSPGDLIEMFLSGRNPRMMAAYGKDLDDFARFLGATDHRSAVESLSSAGQGPANAWRLAWRNETAVRGLTPATIARRLVALALV